MEWQDYLTQNRDRYIAEMLEFLKIPSISAQSEHETDVKMAGQWVADRLKQAGLNHVEMMPTGGHPVVYADWIQEDGLPTVLIYGHFDTQPVDPLDLWDSPPFEPVIKQDRVFARGASDDKGNLFSPITAVEAMLKTSGKLPVNVKFFFEGQEEIGSPQLPDFVAQNKTLLACDLVVSADGLQLSPDQPKVEIGFRGNMALEIRVTGPSKDYHSGLYGGVIQNPIHALTHILASFHDTDGRVAVTGFYDDVREPTPEERQQLAALPMDESELATHLQVPELFGEPGYTAVERGAIRPTLEICGVEGGYQGEGIKGIVPAKAQAKIVCRLAADQDPEKVSAAINTHIRNFTLPGVRVDVINRDGKVGAYLMPHDHPGNIAAAGVLERLYGKAPLISRCGGTIPICSLFLETLGVYTVNFAFSYEDENLHSPNEFFRLESLDRGQRGYVMLLEELARVL
ncbi:MAG: dipeptidase [Desulfobacteraceae bacterium]|nr:MAG: dipeptidase [Desulfobacteraceae bacterium]